MAIIKLTSSPSAAIGSKQIPEVRSIDALENALRARGLGQYPIDVEAVASMLGLHVVFEPMDDDMSGFLERRPTGWTAGVNAYHHPVRQRFTLAHEIAHFVLHRDEQREFRDQTFARRAGTRDRIESEADQFAAQLLMPSSAIAMSIRAGLRNLNELASAFKVSTLAMRYRLSELRYSLS
jgi:predicted transcriptional regulator